MVEFEPTTLGIVMAVIGVEQPGCATPGRQLETDADRILPHPWRRG